MAATQPFRLYNFQIRTCGFGRKRLTVQHDCAWLKTLGQGRYDEHSHDDAYMIVVCFNMSGQYISYGI